MKLVSMVLTIALFYLTFWFPSVVDWSLWWHAPTMVIILVSLVICVIVTGAEWCNIEMGGDEESER